MLFYHVYNVSVVNFKLVLLVVVVDDAMNWRTIHCRTTEPKNKTYQEKRRRSQPQLTLITLFLIGYFERKLQCQQTRPIGQYMRQSACQVANPSSLLRRVGCYTVRCLPTCMKIILIKKLWYSWPGPRGVGCPFYVFSLGLGSVDPKILRLFKLGHSGKLLGPCFLILD